MIGRSLSELGVSITFVAMEDLAQEPERGDKATAVTSVIFLCLVSLAGGLVVARLDSARTLSSQQTVPKLAPGIAGFLQDLGYTLKLRHTYLTVLFLWPSWAPKPLSRFQRVAVLANSVFATFGLRALFDNPAWMNMNVGLVDFVLGVSLFLVPFNLGVKFFVNRANDATDAGYPHTA